MIAKLTGLLDSVGDGWAVIDVNGVGYLIFCSGRTLGKLPGTGEAVRVLIDTHVREDHIHLYGFIDAAERDWFRILMTVQGVGAKVALAILAVFAPESLMQAIAAQDKAAITQAPGVGPKLAVRILTELKDKAGDLALKAVTSTSGPTAKTTPAGVDADGAGNEAASALVNLGYGRSEAFAAVSKAVRELGADAPVAALIRKGLNELAPKAL